MAILQELANIFSSESYAGRISKATRDKIAANGFGTNGRYEPDEYNEIYSNLLNMVSKIQNFGFKYAGLDVEKYSKGFIAYGDAIIDNFVDIADQGNIPVLINKAGDNGGVSTTDPYKIKWANVSTGYYVGDYDLQYQTTTKVDQVKKGFISEAGITNFVAECRNVLPESLKFDRYQIFRNMLASANIYKVSKTFTITPVSSSEPVFSADQAMTIISQIRNYAYALENNNTIYNRMGVHSNTETENRVLFINKGIYNALATAMKNVYHNEIDFGVGTIEYIPDFGETALTSGQFACIVDKRGLMLYDTLEPYSWTIWTGQGLYWNTFLSYRGKIAYALHRNSVRFCLAESTTPEPTPPTPAG